ncbi:MAG TPA: hypothetical protein PKZ84_17490 [Anaerolineae bacterium]|nr:hypothetical protein [Anaerolineae bacterium]HQI86459.1 hypothetical protein [Anaerolineae bacterium]
MAKLLKNTFLVHAVLSGVLGLVMLTAPGRFLQLLGWAPIDPILSRMLGAALLALAWGDYHGWRGAEQATQTLIVQMQLAFAALAGLSVLRHLLVARWPLMVWLLFIGCAAFAVLWGLALRRKA